MASITVCFLLLVFELTFELVKLVEEDIADSDEDGFDDSEQFAESLSPVSRNLVCFCVCEFALCIGMSHSVHRIALSC